MTLFDVHFSAALRAREALGTRRTLLPATREGGMIIREDRPLLDVASNDYLGLADHPALSRRAAEWAMRFGTGARASRLVSGTLDLHQRVEEKIATFKKCEKALLFATGWQANASVLPALCALSKSQTGHPALVFADRLNHASLHHGCMAADVSQIRFRHNDLDHLESLLHRESGKPGLRIIVTESVFSMDGDRADIPALRALADRFKAFLYIDEAHATGVLGPRGGGLCAGRADLVMGTCSKALGGTGAYVAGSSPLCDYLLNHASGFVYSTALPPAVLGAIDAALDLVPDMEAERTHLLALSQRLRDALEAGGIRTLGSTTQIVPALIGEAKRTVAIAKGLEKKGFHAVAIRPPTVPPNTARLRLALSARHQHEDIDRLSSALLELNRSIPP